MERTKEDRRKEELTNEPSNRISVVVGKDLVPLREEDLEAAEAESGQKSKHQSASASPANAKSRPLAPDRLGN